MSNIGPDIGKISLGDFNARTAFTREEKFPNQITGPTDYENYEKGLVRNVTSIYMKKYLNIIKCFKYQGGRGGGQWWCVG